MHKKLRFRETGIKFRTANSSFFSQNKSALFLLLLSFAFIGIGIYRGEIATVLIKSINICLECIGIG